MRTPMRIKDSFFVVATLAFLLLGIDSTWCQAPTEHVEIDANAPATPFPHFWEQMFGSGRAILSLRESYRDDLRAVKKVTDFRYVRFHAILHDEVGVYTEDDHGNPVYNFSYVDQIYDGLLQNGVRPIVEISFMPKQLAFNPDALHPFWYKQNVSPPKSWEKWDGLMTHFAAHLLERYGIEEVSQWYFEVWNEPNIDFWNGIPRQRSYFELYDHTAHDLKSVNPRLRVGGPATAAAAWVSEFLDHAARNHVPVDFVSTHGYADDTVENLFGTDENIPVDDRVGRAIAKVRKQIDASATPHLPLFWTEWSVPGLNEARDTTYVGPALANTVRECDGNVDMMSFWTFSDVFEEGGPIPQPFVGGFGLRAKGGINKPSYYAFGLLHRLGTERLRNASNNVIVTRTQGARLAIAAWNLVDPVESSQANPDQHDPVQTDAGQARVARTIEFVFHGLPAGAHVTVQRIDSDHGNVLKEYAAMGRPLDPTPLQVTKLNQMTELPTPEPAHLQDNRLKVQLSPNTLLLIEIGN